MFSIDGDTMFTSSISVLPPSSTTSSVLALTCTFWMKSSVHRTHSGKEAIDWVIEGYLDAEEENWAQRLLLQGGAVPSATEVFTLVSKTFELAFAITLDDASVRSLCRCHMFHATTTEGGRNT